MMESRIRLHQVLERQTDQFDVTSAHTLDEGLSTLMTGARFDLYFIAKAFEEDAIVNFVERVKRIDRTRFPVFVLLIPSGQTSAEVVGQHMLLGMHGFLCEPYSENGLQEAVKLARGVALQQTRQRLRAAAGLMLSDIMDEHRATKGAAVNGMDLWSRVKETCETYKAVTGESVTTAVVTQAETGSNSGFATYRGVSKRVRDMFRKKFRDRLRGR